MGNLSVVRLSVVSSPKRKSRELLRLAAPRAIRGNSRDRWRLGPQANPPSGWRDPITPGAPERYGGSRVDRRSLAGSASYSHVVPRRQHAPITQCLDLGGHHLTARRRVTHRWTTSFLGAQTERRVPMPVCRMRDRRLPPSDPVHHPRLPFEPPTALRPVSTSDRIFFWISLSEQFDHSESTDVAAAGGREPVPHTC